jgi:hypothetical protein
MSMSENDQRADDERDAAELTAGSYERPRVVDLGMLSELTLGASIKASDGLVGTTSGS